MAGSKWIVLRDLAGTAAKADRWGGVGESHRPKREEAGYDTKIRRARRLRTPSGKSQANNEHNLAGSA